MYVFYLSFREISINFIHPPAELSQDLVLKLAKFLRYRILQVCLSSRQKEQTKHEISTLLLCVSRVHTFTFTFVLHANRTISDSARQVRGSARQGRDSARQLRDSARQGRDSARQLRDSEMFVIAFFILLVVVKTTSSQGIY